MVRPVPAHAAATSCTVPSPPTATTDTSSGSALTILPACPAFSVTCQTGRNPRSSKNRETDARSPPAPPLPADGLRTRCASPPKENIAGKYQNRSPAVRPKDHSSSTRGIDCDESRTIPARSKERFEDGVCRDGTTGQRRLCGEQNDSSFSRSTTESHPKVPATIDFRLT